MRWIAVGKVTTPHGVHGWVKVASLTDNPGRFEQLEKVRASVHAAAPLELKIEDVKYQPDRVLLKFGGVNTVEEAEKLRNRLLEIPESEVIPIEEEDVYYIYQLEGMEVRDAGGNVIGTLESVYNTSSNDVYGVLSPDGKKELLVPAIKKCILSVDLETKVMIVDREWVS